VTFKQIARNKEVWLVVAAGFAVRLIAMSVPVVHPWDYNLFWHWARLLYNDGFAAFYASGAHTDYMPGYMYVLWLKGFVENAFSLTHGGFAHKFVFMFPGVLADLAMGVLIYVWAAETQAKRKIPLFLALAYVFNPAIILISSVWGQVDPIFVLIMALSVYFLTKKRFLAAFLLFSINIVVKQQAIIFGPIYIYFLWDFVKSRDFKLQAFAEVLRNGVICVAVIFAAALPFGTPYRDIKAVLPNADFGASLQTVTTVRLAGNRAILRNITNVEILIHPDTNEPYAVNLPRGINAISYTPLMLHDFSVEYTDGWTIMPVVRQFTETLSQRQFATVNAYNIWGAMGLNWYPLDDEPVSNYFFRPPAAPIRIIGYGFGIIGAAFAGFWLLHKQKKPDYFFAGAVVNIIFFMVSIRVQERYAIAALVMLLSAHVLKQADTVIEKKRRRKVNYGYYKYLYLYAGFSAAFFLNYAVVLYDSLNRWHHDALIRSAMIYSWFAVVPFVYLVYLIYKEVRNEKVSQ
jgi:hypothetical protein